MNQQLNFYKINLLVFSALLMGMIAFTAITYFVLTETYTYSIDLSNPLTTIAPIALLVGITMGNIIFRKIPDKLNANSTLIEKKRIFSSTSIIRYALIEGPVLLSIIAFLLSSNLIFVIIAACGILYFITLKPTADKISKSLDLTYEEREELGFK